MINEWGVTLPRRATIDLSAKVGGGGTLIKHLERIDVLLYQKHGIRRSPYPVGTSSISIPYQ